MAIPNPNPNIADGIKSDNKTYSSNKIESLIAGATELPTPEAGDAGKVLTVNAAEDGYELDTPVAPESIIDDSASAADTVYSSSKVDNLLTELNIKSITRVAVTVTTGATGNIATGVTNDGKHLIISPIISGNDYVCTPWVANGTNEYFITVRGASSWQTVNEQSVNLRYWVVETLTT